MNEAIKQELELIRNENGGFLHPAKVVEYARDEKSALHEQFEWDDSAAAEKFRIAQARAIIRIAVIVEASTSEKVRAYVSLSSDRKEEGGYRAMADVVSDEVLRETLLQDALKELATFQRKYNQLKAVSELGSVFAAIEDVVQSARVEQDQDQHAA